MADNSVSGFGKDPLTTSHGDALADQSFQSLKSKEIRDSLSPTEMKFQSMTLNNPNTTGWNVQSSKEVTPDGRGFRADTVATTDGVESVSGGIAEFKGRNEQHSSAQHQGDDKNFVKKATESSNSHLQEKVVLGDENSGRTEVRTSSSKSSSSSQVIQSSTNVEYDDGLPVRQQSHPQKYLVDSNLLNQQDLHHQRQHQEQQRLLEEKRIYEQQFQQQHQQHLNQQQQRRTTEQVSTTRQNTEQKNVSQNMQTQETLEQNKHYVDMDKASPEYQKHVQFLMQQAGEIISNTVEYPKPNVKMITTVKRLPDGTIVRNKRYETEELPPTTPTTRQTSINPNQTQPRRDSQQPSRNYQPDYSPQRTNRPSHDMVDNATNSQYVQDTYTDDLETKFSSVKKSSSKFSTETSSETIQEVDNHHSHGGPSSRPKPKTNDFTTHGFPSVRPNKPTQDYPNERPHTAHPTQFSPSKPNEAVIPHHTDHTVLTDNITERRVNTKDGEVIVVSSQKQSNFNTSSNSERIVETEHVIRDDEPHQQIFHKTPQDFSTHGFPSVREPNSYHPINYPSDKQMQPHEQDFPSHKLPPGTRIVNKSHVPHDDGNVVIVSSQKSHTAKHSSNSERIIEHDILRDGQQSPYPRSKPNKDIGTPYNYTVTTPGDQTPQGEFPGSHKKPKDTNYSTQGFPSVRTPGGGNDYTTLKSPTRPAAGLPSSHNQHPSSSRKSPSQDYSTQGFPSVRSPNKSTPAPTPTQGYHSYVDGERPNARATPTSKTPSRTPSPNKYRPPNASTVRETTERIIKKEKEVDSAHRAFAASLRSSSPIDHTRRDSYTTDSHARHTPRSSVSSTKNFRRDLREGSHDSAPSETSRVSTTTITRTTPPRTVGGRTVTTKVVTTKTGPGCFTDTLYVTSDQATKSPSPSKTGTTTTTTTRTMTNKDVPKATDNQPTRITTNKIDTLFPINEPPLITSITKIKFSDNHKQPHKKTKTNIRKKKIPVATADHIASVSASASASTTASGSASAKLEVVVEPPCLKKHYYKLGPTDQTQPLLKTTTSTPLKSSQLNEKSPTKKQSSQPPQPAPSSRSSTPSYNSRKPQLSVMADDYDDDNLSASPFSPPSSRSRTPQKNAPNDNDKPRVNSQMSRQPVTDEGRTVNREITFEKVESPHKQPLEPKVKQPHIEWVIVDDVDVYEHDIDDDNNSFTSEVVDAELNVKNSTTKLITQEKQITGTPERKPKPTTTKTTTVTTKQFHTLPSKPLIKPNEKSPLKTKPNDSRTPQQIRTNKTLTSVSKTPVHTPSKPTSKVVDNKPFTRSPKSAVPSYASPLRKSLPKTTTEETTLRKTLKTSQVLKDKTTKLIEMEKQRKPQSPERKPKPQPSDKGKPNGILKEDTTEVTVNIQNHLPDKKTTLADYEQGKQQTTPYGNDNEELLECIANYEPQNINDEIHPCDSDTDEHYQPSAISKKPQQPHPSSLNYTKSRTEPHPQNHSIPSIQKPQDIDNKPRHKSPALRKPLSPGFQKLQSTFDKQSPQFGKPFIADDEVTFPADRPSKQTLVEEHISITETSQRRYPDDKEPQQQAPRTELEPIQTTPGYRRPEYSPSPDNRKPYGTFETNKTSSDYENHHKIYEEDVTISETSQSRVPNKETPKRRPQSPEKPITGKQTRRPVETDEELCTRKPAFEFSEIDDDECLTEKESFVATSQKTVAKHIQKFETNFLETKSPKPNKGRKSPTKGTAKDSSPTRTQNKPQMTETYRRPDSKVKVGKLVTQQLSDTEEEEQTCMISEKNIQVSTYHGNVPRQVSPVRKTGQGFPKEPVDKISKSPERVVSPTRNLKITQEHIDKRPKSPTKHISPNRLQRNPEPKAPKEPEQRRPKSPNKHVDISSKSFERVVSPTRNQKMPQEQTEKRPQSPNKHVSPNRVQRNPEPRAPKEFEEKRPKSPNKHVSPQRNLNTTNEKMPLDHETFTTSFVTTKVVKEKLYEDGENYPDQKPKGLKPTIAKPFETIDDKSYTETAEFVTSSTQKRIVNENLITEFEEPLLKPEKVTKLPTRENHPTKQPQRKPEEVPGKRAQSPNKNVSPTRQKHTTDDKAFTKTLRSNETVIEKLVTKVGDKDYPEEKTPLRKADKSVTKPKQPKSYLEQPSDTEQDEITSVTSDFVINSTQKLILNEQENQEFDTTRYEDFTKPRRGTKSPTKFISPTRVQTKPNEKLPENKFKEPVERPQHPNKHISPTRVQKKPNELITSEDKETFTSSFTAEKYVTQEVDNEQYQQIRKTEKGSKSPTREHTGKRPQSPNKTLSPTRSQNKPARDDETFENSLKVTKKVTEKTSIKVDDKQFPKQETPHYESFKPIIKPKEPKNQYDKPSDIKEDKTFTESITNFVSSNTCQLNEKTILNLESLEITPKHKSTGVTAEIPQPIRPGVEDEIFDTILKTTIITTEKITKDENHDYEYPEKTIPHKKDIEPETKQDGDKPYSVLYRDNEENDTSKRLTTEKTYSISEKIVQDSPISGASPAKTSKTTKFITEKPSHDTEEKPKEFKPKSAKPTETDGDKSFVETTEFVFRSTRKPEYPASHKPDEKPEIDDNETRVYTTEFVRNTSEKLISSEQEALEIELEISHVDLPNKEQLIPKNKDRKPSPTRSTSPPKSVAAKDKTFKKSLRTTTTGTDKVKPKDQKPFLVKSTDTDEEETTTETEDLLVENCEKSYIIETTFGSEDKEKFSTILVKPSGKKPAEEKPDISYTFETTKTIEDQHYPGNIKEPSAIQPSEVLQEPWLPTKQTPKFTINVNEKFVETERARKETPDGAFVSKTIEPQTPTSPTYKKKGAGRSDTFEERCRQILGMETYGDTPGSYKEQPNTEIEENKTVVTKDVKMMAPNDSSTSSLFQVKIEDCDEDDEAFSINTVRKTLHKKIDINEQKYKEPLKQEPKRPHQDEPEKKSQKPQEIFEVEDDDKKEFVETITEISKDHTKRTKNIRVNETEPDFSEPEIIEEKYLKESKTSEVKITTKTSPSSSPRSSSPNKSTSSLRSVSSIKGIPIPKKDTPNRKPSKHSLEPTSNKKSPQKSDGDTTTIKDRLRSSTRKTKSPSKIDQVDGSESSPEHSPTRYTERRRSSNISVTTEIIIEHTDSDTPNKKEKSPSTAKKPKDSVFKEIVDSTVLPEKLTRRMHVTERKESAPVHRVTSKDKDSKMSRSTSENLIKIKNAEPSSPSPKTPAKPSDHRRPNKCFATKSINLSATDRLISSGETENVIIDIQHAKSSREPSPDKIVPTPVPAHLDTGKPRYPDVVQEPEDDHQPRRIPQVKNIPIFEEENNSFVGCHITEINAERTHKTTYDSLDYEEHTLKNPVVETPVSLEYISFDKSSDDESMLTVHEKVNKFQTIAEDVGKPKTTKNQAIEEDIYSTIKLAATAPQKSPELVRTISKHITRQNESVFNNEANEDYPITSHNDDYVECLVDNKKMTKEFKVSHRDTTETATKTAEKHQQPQDDDDDHDFHEDNDDNELIPHTATHTTIIEERRQKDILSRPSVFDSRNKKPTSETTTATTTTTTKTPLKCNKLPIKDSEKLRPDIKSRTKPASAVANTPTEQTIPKITAATTTTTITTTTSNKPKQSPKRKNSDIDYELRGSSNVETGVRNIISKQTKVYSNNTSSDSKTNDLKKPTTTSNKKPEKHISVRLTQAKNPDDHDWCADDEMIVSLQEATTDIDVELQVVNEDLNKETNKKIPSTTTNTPHKQQPTTAHSSTNSSPTDQPLKTKSKAHLVKLTDNNSLKSNTVTTTITSIKTYETIESVDDIDETVLEPSIKKSPSHPHTKPTKMSTTTTDSVAAKRSLFESNNSNSNNTTAHNKRTPLTTPMSPRRPSYMDHTKSSLEHTRRDSLEINKTNYSRKPSQPEEEIDRNSTVKFDVPQPHTKRATTPRTASVTEDINVEEIFDLDLLETLLETVQSYEIRRRIRAQIRLIKKNQKNELISSCTAEVTTMTVNTPKVSAEETDAETIISRKPKPTDKTSIQTTESKEAASTISSSKKEYIFEEAYHPTTRRSPKPNRYPYQEETEQVRKPTRNQSPQSMRNVEHHDIYHRSPERQHHTEMVREHESRSTKKQYYYKDEEEHEEVHEIRHETSPNRKSPSPTRKPYSSSSSPERSYGGPDSRSSSPLKNVNERSQSPQTKRPQSSRSPDGKTSTSSLRKLSQNYEQETAKSSTSKPQTKRLIKTTTSTTTTKSKPEDKAPVWADRKNILKAPSSTTPKKPTTSNLDSRSSSMKTSKSTTSQKVTSSKTSSSFVDNDCVISSYGIGPTDENGLPLFGIRALKKKKATVEPSETTEEVTGYVVEEKYYSDNKTKPTIERKEFIYSTNPEQLQKLKQQVEVTSNKHTLKDVDVKETRKAALISKTTPALRSSPEDDFLDSSSKYVRRGSVKEMSEKFIQKEASSTVTEKSNNYPKAGLILRTNSRKSSKDMDNETENFESYKTTRAQQRHTSGVLADSDDYQLEEYEVEEVGSRHSGRFITAESESESDSIKTQREVKKVTSSSSSSMATRSFLNSQGEEKVITNVSECLERMRNADNVIEEGDTAEDQEARALLNKFLGASIIMKGVESSSSLPATNRQSKIITTTTTSCNLSDDNNDGDNNAKHEVKTTRITKTINSGSSSTPVTYTTCDTEEIWDEEILKELLEQAKTYEERRKIRSRLRELMADREEQKQQKSSSTTETTETQEKDGAVVTTTTKVTTRTVTGPAAKPVSPFSKFKQLDGQNSQQSTKSPTTATTTVGGSTASPLSGKQPIFKFTDPVLNAKAATVKEQLLQWCQSKTQEYENIEITNFSTSWNNGLAFCALIHHFLPDAFDYSQLTPKNRRKNFELAFTVADEKAGIAPLLDVEDMVVMQRPDWKCVFVYVQSIYRRFRNCQ